MLVASGWGRSAWPRELLRVGRVASTLFRYDCDHLKVMPLKSHDESTAASRSGLAALPVEHLSTRLYAKYAARIAARQTQPARAAHWRDLPTDLAPALTMALRTRGLERLYSHQRAAWDLARARRHLVVATPTASGKTLCYNLPVLQSVLNEGPQGALSLSDQGAGAGSGGGADGAEPCADGGGRGGDQGLHLRWGHAGRCAQGGAHARGHRGQQPGHAAPGDPAASHQVGAVLRGAGVRGGR